MSNVPLGFIYFLVMEEPRNVMGDFVLVKIGITKGDVSRRIATLQTGKPYNLSSVGCFQTSCPREVEDFMHLAHTNERVQNEWLRWRRDSLDHLIDEAKVAAGRFEERQRKERALVDLVSNGPERPATHQVTQMHREAQDLKRKLVPEQLRLEIAENRLKSATGDTSGINGIVRVKHVSATIRFSAKLAELHLTAIKDKSPDLAKLCYTETVEGAFQWKGVSRKPDFPEAYETALSAKAAAVAATAEALKSKMSLQALKGRTAELERWHDDFLRATQKVHHFGAKLADVQAEIIVNLADSDGFIGICSFKRRAVMKFQRSAFCGNFSEESARCAVPVAAQLRKQVYRSRSYPHDFAGRGEFES